jgi:DNA (cytosine-5)-methyltransferase 1
MPYAVDLFCGAGGMSEGLLRAGFDILFSNDISPEAGKTYQARHEQLGYKQGVDTYFYLGDIHGVTGDFVWNKIKSLERFKTEPCPEKIDAIFGGPPCQGFSKAGKRKKNDPRNFLFREYLRVISELKPTYVVMENVTGFLDTELTEYISGFDSEHYTKNRCLAPFILKKELNKIGYSVLPKKVLHAEKFGVPQKRHRVIFIAYREGHKKPRYPYPEKTQPVTLEEAISDLSKSGVTELTNYQKASVSGRTPTKSGDPIAAEKEQNTETSKHNEVISERFDLYDNGEDTKTLRERLTKNGLDLSNKQSLLKYCSEQLGKSVEETKRIFSTPPLTKGALDALLTKKNLRRKLDPAEPSLTIMTIPDDYICPFGNRTLSVRECARLQSFDDSFVFLGGRTTGGPRRKKEVPQYSQVGNAVPPLLSFAIGKTIIKAISQDK